MYNETDITRIERYLQDGESEFDRIMEARESRRGRLFVRWAVPVAFALAACTALVLWLAPLRPVSGNQLTPIQIAEGIEQMMLLDIGDIDSIVATPEGSHAILTARLKDGSTCSFILRFDKKDGTTTLLAYNNN